MRLLIPAYWASITRINRAFTSFVLLACPCVPASLRVPSTPLHWCICARSLLPALPTHAHTSTVAVHARTPYHSTSPCVQHSGCSVGCYLLSIAWSVRACCSPTVPYIVCIPHPHTCLPPHTCLFALHLYILSLGAGPTTCAPRLARCLPLLCPFPTRLLPAPCNTQPHTPAVIA